MAQAYTGILNWGPSKLFPLSKTGDQSAPAQPRTSAAVERDRIVFLPREDTLSRETRLEQLSEMYNYRDYLERRRVYKYLRANPDLVDFLYEAYNKVTQFFGPDVEVLLEVEVERELPATEHLFAFIVT